MGNRDRYVLRIQELWRILGQSEDRTSVAELLAAHPECRHIVARTQALAGMAYAELRVNWLAKHFLPFAPVASSSRSRAWRIRIGDAKAGAGRVMQGAPIAEDVEHGREGVGLSAYAEANAGRETLAPLPAAGAGRGAAPRRCTARAQVCARARRPRPSVYTALQARGAALGWRKKSANMVMFAQACGQDAVGELLSGLQAAPERCWPRGSARPGLCPCIDRLRRDWRQRRRRRKRALRARRGGVARAERGLLGLWSGRKACPCRARCGGPWYASMSATDPAIAQETAASLAPKAEKVVAGLGAKSFAVSACGRLSPKCESVAGRMPLSWNSAEWPSDVGLAARRADHHAPATRCAYAGCGRLWVRRAKSSACGRTKAPMPLKVF